MNSIEEGSAGYPEEQPPGADPTDAGAGDTPQREGGSAGADAARAPDNDEGDTATGSPAAAG